MGTKVLCVTFRLDQLRDCSMQTTAETVLQGGVKV